MKNILKYVIMLCVVAIGPYLHAGEKPIQPNELPENAIKLV